MQSRNFAFQRCLAVLIATMLVCGGGPRALAQTNKSTQARSSTSAKASRVNVNSASLKSLETLPGITPSLARKIVAGRPYNNLDDLKKVKGLTQAKITGIKSHITFGATTASTTKTGKKQKSAATATEETTAPTEEATTPTGTAQNPTAQSTTSLPSTGRSSTKKPAPTEPVNINTASLEQLETLPGIGPTRAQAIMDYRQQNGNFGSIEDIQKVKGIKQGEFSKIKDMIKVSD